MCATTDCVVSFRRCECVWAHMLVCAALCRCCCRRLASWWWWWWWWTVWCDVVGCVCQAFVELEPDGTCILQGFCVCMPVTFMTHCVYIDSSMATFLFERVENETILQFTRPVAVSRNSNNREIHHPMCTPKPFGAFLNVRDVLGTFRGRRNFSTWTCFWRDCFK